MRILIVEDEPRIANIIARILKDANYLADTASDAEIALTKIGPNKYDAFIFDIGLPGTSGVELTKQVREQGITSPILILTGFDSTNEKVRGLDAGADDYLTKPFNHDELLARLRAILRRPVSVLPSNLSVGDLELNVAAREVERRGKHIKLMPKEFALLEYLMRRAGEAISKDDLLQHVWGIYSRNSSNRLEVYIRYLREKIDDPFDTKLIQTVRGTGYKISESKA